jgi:uncharacterized membrane protein
LLLLLLTYITLLNTCLLKNLPLSQTVFGIRLNQVKGHVLGICILYGTFATVLLFATLSRYFRKFLVTTSSTKMASR